MIFSLHFKISIWARLIWKCILLGTIMKSRETMRSYLFSFLNLYCMKLKKLRMKSLVVFILNNFSKRILVSRKFYPTCKSQSKSFKEFIFLADNITKYSVQRYLNMYLKSIINIDYSNYFYLNLSLFLTPFFSSFNFY